MDQRGMDSVSENKRRPGDYLTVAEYWKAQYEKEKEDNKRFDQFEDSIQASVKEIIQPVVKSQSEIMEKMGSMEGRLGNVETMKEQKFKKSLEWMTTWRGIILLILGGGSIFSTAWAWLQKFFESGGQ